MSTVRKKSLPCTLVFREMCAPGHPGAPVGRQRAGSCSHDPLKDGGRPSPSAASSPVVGGGRHPLRPVPPLPSLEPGGRRARDPGWCRSPLPPSQLPTRAASSCSGLAGAREGRRDFLGVWKAQSPPGSFLPFSTGHVRGESRGWGLTAALADPWEKGTAGPLFPFMPQTAALAGSLLTGPR